MLARIRTLLQHAATPIVGVTLLLVSISLPLHADPTLQANMGYIDASSLPTANDNQLNPIRLQAIRQASMTLGAKGALAWQSLKINHSLAHEAHYLDRIFNFNPLLINGNVLPPVLVENNNSLNQASDTALRLSAKNYALLSPARFVTTAPNWRNYLWMNYPKPKVPNTTLLPKTQAEAAVWNHYLKQGWIQGVAQAKAIFRVNLNRLKRDFTGMILYRKLLSEHMVSAPFVAQTNMGVTGDATHLRIDDKILRITTPAKLQPNSADWTPIFTP